MIHKTNLDTIEADLNKSLLTLQKQKDFYDVTDIGWCEVNNKEDLVKTIGFGSIDKQDILQATQAILKIPYPNTDFARIKLYPAIAGNKYLQPKGIAPKPYILSEIVELKEKPHKPIILTEGEKKTICLIHNGYNAIGLPGVWQFKNQKQGNCFLPELNEWSWKNRTAHICFDSDAIYNENVLQAEIELALNLYVRGAKVYVIRIPQENHNDKMGVDDFITNKGIDTFKSLYNEAKPFYEAYPFNSYATVIKVIKRLYEQEILKSAHIDKLIKMFAKSWKVKVGSIEKDLKIEKQNDKDEHQSIVEELEPFNGDVDMYEVYNEVKGIFEKYIYMPSEHQYTAVSLWVLLSYVYEHFYVLPQLLISSPTKRCGKTALLTTIRALTNRSLVVSNISAAAVYRVTEKYKPTLLIDEADESLAKNDEVAGIFNAGHTRDTAFVVRTGSADTDFEPERFNTFAPKVIAMIGKPKSTQVDRSIVIEMERKPRGVKKAKIPMDLYEKMKEIRAKLLKWATTFEADKVSESDFDEFTNDRLVDNWMPLLSIAHGIREDIYKEAKQSMSFIESNADDMDEREQLLQDIYDYFESSKVTKVFSSELIEHLNSLEDKPWGDKRNGAGITANWLSRKLRNFKIKPKKIRKFSEAKNGYVLDDFKEVFERYLIITHSQSGTTGTMVLGQEIQEFQNGTKTENVPFSNSRKMVSGQDCSTCSVLNTGDKAQNKKTSLFNGNKQVGFKETNNISPELEQTAKELGIKIEGDTAIF